MADNVALNAMGGGSVVATDEVTGTGEHIQVVKLAYSANGSRTPITADADGLKVNSAEAITTSDALAGTEKLLPLGAYNDYFSSWQPLQTTGNFSTKALWVSLYGEAALAAGNNVIGGVTQSDGPWTTVERGATIAQGSATIGTAMGTVLTSSATRRTILIQNLGTDYVWLGGSTAIVVNTGARLAPGQAITIDKSPISAIYAVASSGSQTVCYFTESD